jgi:DNA sulfur modification protein DndB
MPETEKPFFENLAEVALLKGEIRKRKDQFIYETIKKARLKEYLEEGWEESKLNVNTVRVKKLKTHDVLFEDRVWDLFARLSIEHMNKNRNFRIQYSKEAEVPGKQIDVFAADTETVILVECKSTESRKSRNILTTVAFSLIR